MIPMGLSRNDNIITANFTAMSFNRLSFSVNNVSYDMVTDESGHTQDMLRF